MGTDDLTSNYTSRLVSQITSSVLYGELNTHTRTLRTAPEHCSANASTLSGYIWAMTFISSKPALTIHSMGGEPRTAFCFEVQRLPVWSARRRLQDDCQCMIGRSRVASIVPFFTYCTRTVANPPRHIQHLLGGHSTLPIFPFTPGPPSST